MTPNEPSPRARRSARQVAVTATEIKRRLGVRRNRLTDTELSAVAMAMAEAIHATNTRRPKQLPGR